MREYRWLLLWLVQRLNRLVSVHDDVLFLCELAFVHEFVRQRERSPLYRRLVLLVLVLERQLFVEHLREVLWLVLLRLFDDVFLLLWEEVAFLILLHA